jgi:PQQ-dependent catabolism-associated CXXCW motif protein
VHGDLPATIAGGQVAPTESVAALLKSRHVVLLDVSPAPKRPPHASPSAPWLPLPHQDIPGSVWIPGAGEGAVAPALALHLAQVMDRLTGGRADTPIVVYCHPDCWMSWNAARRLVWLGYRRVYWDPDGIEGWARSGRQLAKPR